MQTNDSYTYYNMLTDFDFGFNTSVAVNGECSDGGNSGWATKTEFTLYCSEDFCNEVPTLPTEYTGQLMHADFDINKTNSGMCLFNFLAIIMY